MILAGIDPKEWWFGETSERLSVTGEMLSLPAAGPYGRIPCQTDEQTVCTAF